MCSYNCTSTYFNPKWVCHPHLFLLLQLQFKKKLCAQIAQQVHSQIHESKKNTEVSIQHCSDVQLRGLKAQVKHRCRRLSALGKLMAFPNQKTFPHPKLHPVSNQNFHHGSSSSCAAGPVDRTFSATAKAISSMLLAAWWQVGDCTEVQKMESHVKSQDVPGRHRHPRTSLVPNEADASISWIISCGAAVRHYQTLWKLRQWSWVPFKFWLPGKWLQCLFRNVSNAVPWGPCLTGLALLANTVWATVSLWGGGCGRSLAAETPWPCFIGGIYPKQEKNTQETQGHAKNNIWSGLFKQHQEVAQYDAMCYIKRCWKGEKKWT